MLLFINWIIIKKKTISFIVFRNEIKAIIYQALILQYNIQIIRYHVSFGTWHLECNFFLIIIFYRKPLK